MAIKINKQPFNIAFDMDDTLVYTGVVKEANKKFKNKFKKFTDTTKRDWKFSNFPEELRQEIFKLFNIPEFMCGKAKPIDGAKRLIKKLKQDGHNLIIITARVSKIRKATRLLVKEMFPEISKVIFVGIDSSKKDMMLKHKIDFWIDDAPHEVINASYLGIPSFLIQNDYTPYNLHIKKMDKVKIVRSIKHIKHTDFKI